MKLTIEEKKRLDTGFVAAFGCAPERYFSAPGRTEIGGNHTDHQRGRVLAAAVNLDTRAAVRCNGTNTVRVLSEGYPLCSVDLTQLEPQEAEKNTTAALIRGVAAGLARLARPVWGFDAYVMSTVLPGSGLSSSAVFEVLIGTIFDGLTGGDLPAPQIAAVGQFAENVYFGKPCGLMDQMASAAGGLVAIDFADRDEPVIKAVDFDFSACGHALCIIDTHASHADLTEEYAAVPAEMKQIATHFGCEVLTQVPEAEFYAALPALRKAYGDRSVLRAMHFYEENVRVLRQTAALECGDFRSFLELVNRSGRSSFMYLQNVLVRGSCAHQDVALALALCDKLLEGHGAFRVHGGGFAGTVQAFVPFDRLEHFQTGIDRALGQGSCHVLSIRPEGGVELEVEV